VATGTLFGFFQAVKALQQTLDTKRLVFCFDAGPSKRKDLFPNYKANRHKVVDEDKEEAMTEVRRQIDLLRTDYLERLGYKNVFWQRGYEADDIIASVCNNLKDGHRAVIVSADKDLYQLLSPAVSIWNPRIHSQKGTARFTHKLFKEEHCGLTPDQWYEVKAIAGCASDNVPGVFRVGETIAAAYVCGRAINASSKRAIDEWRKSTQYVTNLKLVRLPYPGCKDYKPVKDIIDPANWDKLMKELGMVTLREGDF
jgi:DNA polymerase-1